MNPAQPGKAQAGPLIVAAKNETLHRLPLQGIEYRFGLLLAIFGLVFVFVLPPVQAPDEKGHFIHAYSVAHGQWLPPHDARGWAATDMPVSFLRMQVCPEGQSRWQYIRELLKVHSTGERCRVGIGSLSIYHFFPYLPQAVGMRVARLLKLRPLLAMYAGRLGNLAFGIFCVVLAIRLAPLGKLLFGAIALLPMTVQQFASLSADAPTNGLSLVLVAALLRVAVCSGPCRSPVPNLAVLLLTFAVALTKLPYTILALLYFGMSPGQAESRRRYWLTGMLILAVAAAGVAASFAMIRPYLPDPHWFPGHFDNALLSQRAQAHFIRTHPLQYLYVFLDSVAGRSFTWLQTLFILGSLDTHLNGLASFGYLFFLAVLAVADGRPEGALSWRLWSVGAAVIILSASAILTSQYMWWTPLANSWIEGPQGRYFIPLLPMFFLLLRNGGIRVTANERFLARMTLCIPALFLTYSLTTLTNRFYFRENPPLLLSPPWLLGLGLLALSLCWGINRWLLDREPADKAAPSTIAEGSPSRQAA
jgi:uncharacterized membrane protein